MAERAAEKKAEEKIEEKREREGEGEGEGREEAMDGNEAAAYVAYAMSEFVIIFPITPSSPMAEKCDAWAASSKPNCLGTVPIVSQLLLMIPNMYKMAGERIPAVIHLAARQVGSSATSIYSDHADAMAVRSTGWAMLCSASAQEAMDMAAAAHAASLEASIPTVHFFDGFTTSHSLQTCVRIPAPSLAALFNRARLSEFRRAALNPDSPHQRGCVVGRQEWMQMAEASNSAYAADYPAALESALCLVSSRTGRSQLELYRWSGAGDAQAAIVIMGSAGLTVEECVESLCARGEKVGVLRVRMFRPWSPSRFISALPISVRRIAVLDRCKDPAASGEPLFLDVCATVYEHRAGVLVAGGRYGLGDKLFGPAHVAAVFSNLRRDEPKRRFTVGIVDDLTHLSLPLDPLPPSLSLSLSPSRARQAIIWGMGSDGSVGACHMALRLLARGAGQRVQGQFFYTAHKSGGVTMSHLRYGEGEIKSMYPIEEADYVGCHQQSYVGRYDVLSAARCGGTVVVNAPWKSPHDVPPQWRRGLADKRLSLYALDAAGGFKRAASLALTAVFLRLAAPPHPDPVELLKGEARLTFSKKGEAVVAANVRAIDEALAALTRIEVPSEWAAEPPVPLGQGLFEAPRTDFEREVKWPLQLIKADDVPVSVIARLVPGGRAPLGTTATEKRGIADLVPVWSPAKCVQCCLCSAACPHAAIRPFLLTKEEDSLLAAPPAKQATGPAASKGLLFRIQTSPMDCTGCGVCATVCPTKSLDMVPLQQAAPIEAPRWKSLSSSVPPRPDVFPRDNLRGLQFVPPLFEFSGACAGCGEAPHLKMLTQMMGERSIFVCASGCNAAYAFAFGSNPYCTTAEGRGPATAHSLFEDPAEFGMGAVQAVQSERRALEAKVKALLASPPAEGEADLRAALAKWLEVKEDGPQCEVQRKEVLRLLEAAGAGAGAGLLGEIRGLSTGLAKKVVWAIGGDGWASDIDFAGIDHVLGTGLPVKMLVLDTEVYSNTGGQQSKATPQGAVHKFSAGGKPSAKKDLAMTFITAHGASVYVASVCSLVNPVQAMKAFAEAESFPGPAVIVAYSPCIEHGIEGASPSGWVAQAKRAVDSGYWPMYRNDPRKAPKRLQLDLPALGKTKIPLADFLTKENRFTRLQREHPQAAAALLPALELWVADRMQQLIRMSS
jgi:pyruvate-ferredoxin/flavodoxin oxidoreductase